MKGITQWLQAYHLSPRAKLIHFKPNYQLQLNTIQFSAIVPASVCSPPKDSKQTLHPKRLQLGQKTFLVITQLKCRLSQTNSKCTLTFQSLPAMEHFDPDNNPGFLCTLWLANQNITGQVAQNSQNKRPKITQRDRRGGEIQLNMLIRPSRQCTFNLSKTDSGFSGLCTNGKKTELQKPNMSSN